MKFCIEVALPVPLRNVFSYLPLNKSKDISYYKPGARVKVPFGKREIIGIITKITTHDQLKKPIEFELKNILEVLDQENILTPPILDLSSFAAQYYHHPIGEVYFSGIPKAIRQGEDLDKYTNKTVLLNTDSKFLTNNKKLNIAQKKLINLLENNYNGLSVFTLEQLGVSKKTIDSLALDHWVYIKDLDKVDPQSIINPEVNPAINPPAVLKQNLINLNSEQSLAIENILKQTDNLNTFICYLLYGVTGSGKTEVYMHLIYQAQLQNKQVLVLVPEISLTPQTIERFKNRFNTKIAVIHSKIGVTSKAKDWLSAKNNQAGIILGTRSAVFTPIHNLGLIIIDEEHDQSFKQQEGFRYNARDLALVRAKKLNIPIVLGSATPSLESVANVINKKYNLLSIKNRAGNAKPPNIKLLNIKQKKITSGLSDELIKLIKIQLTAGQQVLLFLNRRGYAPVIKCNDCSWGGICDRCNVYYTVHKQDNLMICHCCSVQKKLLNTCPECHSKNLFNYGVGTEQVEDFINNIFKDYVCLRIDRDTTKNKHDLENHLEKINTKTAQILIGTQMLAKGHHFPNVTLVAILDCDNSLFSTDFRAPERLTQLLLQVAGRAGRGDRASEVIIQTMQPEHYLLQDILHKDYWEIAENLYKLREQAQLPPCNSWVLLRAESNNLTKTMDFLHQIKNIFVELNSNLSIDQVNIAGPVFAPRVKKAGFFRGQLLFSSAHRLVLQNKIGLLLDKITELKINNIKWSLDVDPQDIY